LLRSRAPAAYAKTGPVPTSVVQPAHSLLWALHYTI